MRTVYVLILLCLTVICRAQTFVSEENDSTALTEYYDGMLWAYRNVNGIEVGLTSYKTSDGYNYYYRIDISIKNLGDTAVTFQPEEVYSELTTQKGETVGLKVYSSEGFQKKLRRNQNWAEIVSSFTDGLTNRTASTGESIILSKMMADERRIKEQGYLKKTTIRPGEGIAGYMFIKKKKGKYLTIGVPLNNHVYSYKWYVGKGS